MPPESTTRAANGSHRLVWWLLVFFSGLATASTGFAFFSLNGRVEAIVTDAATRGERLRAVEVQNSDVGRRLDGIEKALGGLTDEVRAFRSTALQPGQRWKGGR